MDLFPLNRLQITGSLNYNTPTSVITEICFSHGLKYNDVHLNNSEYVQNIIDLIYTENVKEVKPPYDREVYKFISRFVNRNGGWNRGQLDIAFEFLRKYTGASGELPLNSDFHVGLQTNDHPISYNACVLYKLCRQYQIAVNRKTTINQMAQAIRVITLPVPNLRSLLISHLTSHLVSLEKTQLVNLLSVLPVDNLPTLDPIMSSSSTVLMSQELVASKTPSVNDPIDYNRLLEATILCQSIPSLRQRIEPKTNNEAVILAALNYKIDLTGFTSPFHEYQYLSQSPYIPTEEPIRKIFLKNRNYLRTDVNFNLQLPISVYTAEELRNMARAEGYQSSDLRRASYHELLQLSYHSSTFYHGLQKNVVNLETPITLESLDGIDGDSIVCYGIKEESLIAFRYSELADSFRSNQNFIHPTNPRACIEQLAIRKLKNLCQNFHHGESVDSTNERRRLFQIITDVELVTGEQESHALEFRCLFMTLTPEIKEEVKLAIKFFFEIGMYMRGWNGTGPLPLQKSQTLNNNQPQVDLNTSNAIVNFENKCRDLASIGTAFLNLPLLRYCDGRFTASSEPNQGLTIKDRINIIKTGDAGENMNSCIRLSSNWISYTAYRYMLIIGETPPYDINNLEFIS